MQLLLITYKGLSLGRSRGYNTYDWTANASNLSLSILGLQGALKFTGWVGRTRIEQGSEFAPISTLFSPTARPSFSLFTSFLHHSAPIPLVLVVVLVTVLVRVTALDTVLVTVVEAGPLVIKHEHALEIPWLPRPREI
jgi:hypothetical protein